MTTIPLSTAQAERLAPQTLVTALIVTPDGGVTLDVGALHGRSGLESGLEPVRKRELVGEGQSCWIVWVAIELDQHDRPVRYKGLSVCELFVNADKRLGYKSLAEHVNRMAEAMRGEISVTRLSSSMRAAVKQQLVSIGAELWERSAESLKAALGS